MTVGLVYSSAGEGGARLTLARGLPASRTLLRNRWVVGFRAGPDRRLHVRVATCRRNPVSAVVKCDVGSVTSVVSAAPADHGAPAPGCARAVAGAGAALPVPAVQLATAASMIAALRPMRRALRTIDI